MTRRVRVLALAVLALAGLDACRKKPETQPMPATTQTVDMDAAQRRADSIAAVTRAQRTADSIAAARAASTTPAGDAAGPAEARRLLVQKVYFDYDKDDLRDDARAVLDAKAQILLANPTVALVITGHTDERGTAEYNLALGQRRAAQTKRYLTSRGVSESRLTTQSLGDSEPAVQGTDEAAYQQNRRAEFEVQGGTGALMRPRP